MAVVVRGGGHGTTVERTVLPAGGTVRLGLPATDDHLTVSCHSDDGRSAVGTHRPGDVGPVVISLREGSVLLDSG